MPPRRKRKPVARAKREPAKGPAAVGAILDGLKLTTALGIQLQQAEIWNRWPEIAGHYLATHGHPKSIRDNTLYIEADSAVWMNKFAYQKWDLLKRINRISGRELVSDLFILLKGEPEPPSPQPSA